MQQFGLTGYPLGHSLSPFIHSRLFSLRGREAGYELFELEESALEKNIGRLASLGGFNVTIPHKVSIIKYLDSLDEKAALFGAVNTVSTNGALIGHNTDCTGFLRALSGAGMSLSGRVLVCGNGGAARMAAFEAALHGCDLTVACRPSSLSEAEKLCGEISKKLSISAVACVYEKLGAGWDLIINCTSCGMFPNTQACPLPDDIIKSASAVFDVIYNPAETQLLKKAAQAGIPAENGLSMLVWQAAAAQEIWLGESFEPAEIAAVTKETQKELLGR